MSAHDRAYGRQSGSTSAAHPQLSNTSWLLLTMLFPVLFIRGGVIHQHSLLTALAYGLTAGYLLLDIWDGDHDTFRARRFLISLLIGIMVIAPTLWFILMRQATGPQWWVHDNPLQIEEAARMLTQGINPYAADFTSTPMALWKGYGGQQWSSDPNAVPPPDWNVNPALFHVVSLPFGLLAAVPFYAASMLTLGWFDARFLYLLAYLVVLRLVSSLTRDREQRLTALVVIGINPLLTPFVIEGRNDILVFSLLFGAAAAWQRDRRIWAGVLLGLAMSTKHIAVFFLPFYALLGWSTELPRRQQLVALTRHLLVPGLTILAMVLPFLVWDARAFFDDTFGYLAGTLKTSFPMKGIGLGGMAVELGWVANAAAPFPTTLIQALTAGPLLVGLLWKQYRANTLRQALFGYGLFLMVYMWSSRFYHDNYLGYIVLVLAIAHYWPAAHPSRVVRRLYPGPAKPTDLEAALSS